MKLPRLCVALMAMLVLTACSTSTPIPTTTTPITSHLAMMACMKKMARYNPTFVAIINDAGHPQCIDTDTDLEMNTTNITILCAVQPTAVMATDVQSVNIEPIQSGMTGWIIDVGEELQKGQCFSSNGANLDIADPANLLNFPHQTTPFPMATCQSRGIIKLNNSACYKNGSGSIAPLVVNSMDIIPVGAESPSYEIYLEIPTRGGAIGLHRTFATVGESNIHVNVANILSHFRLSGLKVSALTFN